MARRNYEDNRVVDVVLNTSLAAGASVDTGWFELPKAMEYFARVVVSSTDAPVTLVVETAEDNVGTNAATVVSGSTSAAGVVSLSFDTRDIPVGHKYGRVTATLDAGSVAGANVAILVEGMRYMFKPANGVDTVIAN